jgi:hypothetical protein
MAELNANDSDKLTLKTSPGLGSKTTATVDPNRSLLGEAFNKLYLNQKLMLKEREENYKKQRISSRGSFRKEKKTFPKPYRQDRRQNHEDHCFFVFRCWSAQLDRCNFYLCVLIRGKELPPETD